MSRDAAVTDDFGDGTYTFRLGWGELETLQESCDAGPYVVLDRLLTGRWHIEDIAETIRLGLIGGGATPAQALFMVRTYVKARPPVENLALAQRVLGAAVVGAPEESVGKKEPAATGTAEASQTSPTENSVSRPSTPTAP